MIAGTDSLTGFNECGTALARERGFTLSRHFTAMGRALVELIGETASELWDIGKYENTLMFTPTLTQEGPTLLQQYPGRLDRKSFEDDMRVRSWLRQAGVI